MAGKELYIGKMLENLENNMQDVSDAMGDVSDSIADTTTILKEILANMGLTKSQTLYSGQDLIDLNPTLTKKYNFAFNDTTANISFNYTDGIKINVPYDLGTYPAPIHTEMVIPAEVFNDLVSADKGITIRAHAKNGGNGYIKTMFTPSMWLRVNYYVGGVNTDCALCYDVNFGTGNVTEGTYEYTIHAGEPSVKDQTVFVLAEADPGTDVTIIVNNRIACNQTSLQIELQLLDNEGISLIDSAKIDTTGDIVTFYGSGSLLYSITESNAAQLSDAFVLATLNNGDTISLLDKNGNLIKSNTGKTIPLVDIDSNEFKLLFNLSDGSEITSIAVRYY